MSDNLTPIIQKQTPYGVFEVYTTAEGISRHSYWEVTQVHSAEVIHCLPSHSAQEISAREADGILYHQHDLRSMPRPNFLIKTADCLPVFLGSKLGGVMLHAGWRGLQQKILQHPLVKKLKPDYAFIGPHICQNCYQVGPEFQEYFPNGPGPQIKNGQWYFGLQAEADFQIREMSATIHIEHSDLCTFCGALYGKRLHSYRRGNAKQRNYNIFRPNIC
ncbi:MAG: polyphenol oxidase family protein [Bdellovibrio sp.]|nr:polyphenol oxidase family protein [Bdellovibrio sp.]